MIPTVRVANPADPTSFMTINAADYRELVHGPLWDEQAPGFAGLPPPTPQRADPAVRDLAAALAFSICDMDRLTKGKTAFGTLSPLEQITVLRDLNNEVEKSRADYMRHRQVSDRQASEDAAAAARAQAGANENQGDSGQDGSDGGAPPAPAQDAGQGGEKGAAAPAQPPVGNNPFGNQPTPPAPEKVETTVEKGPASKWYVMRGKDPVSEGFATKAEAEKAKIALVA